MQQPARLIVKSCLHHGRGLEIQTLKQDIKLSAERCDTETRRGLHTEPSWVGHTAQHGDPGLALHVTASGLAASGYTRHNHRHARSCRRCPRPRVTHCACHWHVRLGLASYIMKGRNIGAGKAETKTTISRHSTAWPRPGSRKRRCAAAPRICSICNLIVQRCLTHETSLGRADMGCLQIRFRWASFPPLPA